MQLTATLSDALIDLVQEDAAPIDAIEVGQWYSVKQIRRVQALLPGWQFHFHAGNIVTKIGWMPGTVGQIKAYLQCTKSPWASCHLTLLRPGHIWLALRLGLHLPAPNIPRAAKRFVGQIAGLARDVGAPILLENMPAPPDEKKRYDFESDAELINGILEKTGCGMLLDLAHARVAAASRGMEVRDYLGSLPLEKGVQIHVSGPRAKDGYLRDAHEPLQEVDYTLLEWVLAQTRPQVVTLEYYREQAPLHEQLAKLRTMLPA